VKKVFSILFALAIILSGVHITVSTHYCGGKVAASEISFSGKLASCGMEGNEDACPVPGQHLTTHCCEDIVSDYTLNNNFEPSASFIPESYKNNFQIFSIAAGIPACTFPVINSIYTNVSPPGALMSTDVDLSGICVFRI
jgi:hypothetical protein